MDFQTLGSKKLVWAKKGSDWKIIKETWIPRKKNYIIKMYRFLQKRLNNPDRFHAAINLDT